MISAGFTPDIPIPSWLKLIFVAPLFIAKKASLAKFWSYMLGIILLIPIWNWVIEGLRAEITEITTFRSV